MDQQMTPAPAQINQPKRRKGVVTAVLAAGAAALLAGIIATTTAGGGIGGGPEATSIPSLAPADADTFVLAPYSTSWWPKVAAMAPPETGVAALDPSASGIAIKHVGYSRSQDHEQREIPMTGPSRFFYVETATVEDAEKLAEWFKHAEGFEGRRVFVEGTTVVIARNWVKDFKAPEQSMAGVAGYADTMSSRDGSMYRSPDKEVQSLAGGADTTNGKALTAVMRNGFGFTEGTTWVGASTDGSSWEGDFRSGGVDPDQIRFDEAQNALDATSVKIAEVKDGNVTFEGYSSGVGGILETSTFRAEGKGSLGRAETVASGIPAVKGEVISVVSDVTGWDAAATGNYSSRENVATQAVSANERSMVVSFEYGAR
jgi:hypothetical protein